MPIQTGTEDFSLLKNVQTSSVAQPASFQWLLGALFPAVKRPGCEVDHSPPSSTEVKNEWNYTSISLYMISWRARASFFTAK